ncbi:hypothetical protein ACWDUO_33185, partial [Streptomyces sp. NPDC003401]
MNTPPARPSHHSTTPAPDTTPHPHRPPPPRRPPRRAARPRRAAALAALALLAPAACGYGSKAEDDPHVQVAAGAAKTDGLDSVRIGYFGNLTHATALVGVNKGYFQKALGATKASYQIFNAGPSE